jgi:hypothetical protein
MHSLENYHALLQRYQLDMQGSKLGIRMDARISAYSLGTDELLLKGYSAPCGACGHYLSLSGLFTPFPSGAPDHSKPRSFKDSILIRNMAAGLGGGMTLGLGRI